MSMHSSSAFACAVHEERTADEYPLEGLLFNYIRERGLEMRLRINENLIHIRCVLTP